MVSLNKADILELELKVKEDLKTERHNTASSIQRVYNDFDDIRTDIALNKLAYDNMSHILKELRDLFTEHIRKDEEKQEQNGARLEKILEKMEDRMDKMDERYASKLTEKLVYWLVALVLTAVFTALVALIIK